jgi:hypothetical protein
MAGGGYTNLGGFWGVADATATATATATVTPTATSTATATATVTGTATATLTSTRTPTATATSPAATPSATATATPPATASATSTGTPPATRTPTATPAASSTATRTPTITPTPYRQPAVGVQVVPGAVAGRLTVTITARDANCTPNNRLVSIQVTALQNAVIQLPDSVLLQATPFSLPIPPNSNSVSFTLVRRPDSPPNPAGDGSTASLLVTDGCGAWPTFVGGGVSAF